MIVIYKCNFIINKSFSRELYQYMIDKDNDVWLENSFNILNTKKTGKSSLHIMLYLQRRPCNKQSFLLYICSDVAPPSAPINQSNIDTKLEPLISGAFLLCGNENAWILEEK